MRTNMKRHNELVGVFLMSPEKMSHSILSTKVGGYCRSIAHSSLHGFINGCKYPGYTQKVIDIYSSASEGVCGKDAL